MRLEQLVLHGPGEDDRIRFGSGITVFSGLGPKERGELLTTLSQALTGRLPVASVVYEDHEGRRVFADRTGATDAVTGARVPGPGQLLGHDPEAVAALMRITATDLDLGTPQSVDDLRADLEAARQVLDRVTAEYEDLRGQADLLTTWQDELEVLNKRIIQSQDDHERWAWVQVKHRTDQLRAELAMLGGEPEENDARILAAVDTLRASAQVWADAVEATAALRSEIGPVPDLDPTHLARVAATPERPPADLDGRLERWRAAAQARTEAEAALAALDDGPPTIDDPLVAAFAACDQPRLWAAHAQLEAANEEYLRVTANAHNGGLDPETEEQIEAAHREVVRCERDVERRFRPGVLGAGTLAVGALLAGQAVSVLLGVGMLAAAVAMGIWLIVVPRRALGRATFAEEAALSHADGGSWLGLHLRRLDAFTDPNERRSVEDAANGRAAAQLDWDEVANGLSLEDLTTRTDQVREYVRATDPRVVARRRDEESQRLATATTAEDAARQALVADLEPYGVVADTDRLALAELESLLEQRIAAGQVARRIVELRRLETAEEEAAEALGVVLADLGHTDGDITGRMGRAIAAIDSARRRAGTDPDGRTRAELQAEVAELELRLETTRRPNWADTPDPTGPPADPNLLDARRRDINELMNTAGKIDVVGAEHRLAVARNEVETLERRIELADAAPTTSLHQRIIARLDRVTVLEGAEDTIPVLFDDPFGSLTTAERLDILDLLVRLSGHVQVIVLTADPVIARWGKDRSRNPAVVLYESTVEPPPARQPKAPRPAVDHHVIPAESPAMVEIY